MELMEVSPFFALDAEDLIRSGRLADACELCKSGVSSYPDYPAGYCVLADIYWECQEYEKSYEILESASLRFPGNRAVAAKIDIFAVKARELVHIIQSDGTTDESPGEEIISAPELSDNQDSIYTAENFPEEPDEYDIEDEVILDQETNPLYFRKNFIRNLPFSADSFRKHDLLRARNLSLIPGLESSPLIPTGNRELVRNYIEDVPSCPKADSLALEKVKQLKLRNNQQSNMDISLFDDRYDDDSNDVKSVSPVMTETLARIYESQQLWATAISAYEILAERNPENEALYRTKIAMLKEKL